MFSITLVKINQNFLCEIYLNISSFPPHSANIWAKPVVRNCSEAERFSGESGPIIDNITGYLKTSLLKQTCYLLLLGT